MSVIDCSVHATPYIPCLKAAGVTAVIRYYAPAFQSIVPEKRLFRDEAVALSEVHISIGVVYQFNAVSDAAFSQEQGLKDGRFARDNAANKIKQPAGSAIYFGVDYDAEPYPDPQKKNSIEKRIIPHFKGLAAAMAEQKNYASYDIGVYGSWNVCDRLSAAKLVKFTWLSQSETHGGKERRMHYVQSKAWNLLQGMPRKDDLCDGLEYDLNQVKEGQQSFGQFTMPS